VIQEESDGLSAQRHSTIHVRVDAIHEAARIARKKQCRVRKLTHLASIDRARAQNVHADPPIR
jgi:hypothetical protein